MSERYIIPNPCTKQKWAEMEGNGRARLCRECNTLVHNIEAYSEAEWERLWRESGGKLCGMRGAESPREVRSRRAVLAGVLLTAISPLMAQTGRLKMQILDDTGAVIPNTQVQILDAQDRPVRAAKSNDIGEVDWADLPLGNVRFRTEFLGFKIDNRVIAITGAPDQKVDVVLEVIRMGEVVRVTI